MPALAPLALVLALAADGPRTFSVAAGSTLAYRLVHRLHEVEGVAREVEGKARVLPDGRVQVMVRARTDAFDSGNGNRDAHMREAVEAARFPHVALKAVGRLELPATFPAELALPLRGELEFHGRTQPVELTVKVAFASADRATVEGTFPVSLTAHGVERPSLLFVKVEDAIQVDARLALEASP